MNYTLTDNLPDLRVGDTLTLEDGSIHEAVDGNENSQCCGCSVYGSTNKGCPSFALQCIGKNPFHFKQIK